MAGSKYAKPILETRLNSGKRQIKGQGCGPKTAAKRQALKYPQAESVINKFGGARKLAKALNDVLPPEDQYNPSTIYRWIYPRSAGGTDGEIPVSAMKAIIKAARYAGILMTVEDLYPVGLERLRL